MVGSNANITYGPVVSGDSWEEKGYHFGNQPYQATVTLFGSHVTHNSV